MSQVIVSMKAGSYLVPAANAAPDDKDVGINKPDKYRMFFDDTTDEGRINGFIIPEGINYNEEVTVIVIGFAKTAAANKNIKLSIQETHQNVNESWDVAYISHSSGDKAISAVQDAQNYTEWTFPASALRSKDNFEFLIERNNSGVSNNLVGDYSITEVIFILPVSP